MPNPSIKNERVYRALRRKGMAKERAARIANSKTSATAPVVVSPTGPGGLFSAYGLDGPAKRRTKTMRPSRRRLWRQAYQAAKASGADAAAARQRAGRALRGADLQRAGRLWERAQVAALKEGEWDESKVSRADDGKFGVAGGGAEAPAAEPADAAPKPKPKPKPAPKVPKAEQAAANLASVGDVLNANDDERLGKAGLAALAGFGDGKAINATMQAGLEKVGLVKTDRDGVAALTPEGRKVIAAAKKGDADAVGKALDDAGKRVAGATGRAAAAAERKATLEARRAERAAKQKPAGAAPAAKPDKPKKGGGGKKEPEKAAPLPPLLASLYQTLAPTRKAFAVTKDARGRHRWIVRTTTAYRDRDGEILSESALDRDSQRMTSTKSYGPLRYWHMGAPDSTLAHAPWGPGVDLGMCDYSQVIGRTRIESGTFFDERVGAAFGRAADQYEASPGFFHTPDQPESGSVFTHIETFERSVVPVRLARASNLFTGMATTKERSMTPDEFRKRAKAFLADMAAMGVDPAAAQQTLAAAQTAEKAATAQGIAYKAATDAPPVYELPDGAPAIIVEGRLVALKAATVKAPMPPAEMIAAGTTEVEDGADELAEEDVGEDGPILGPADLEAIAGAVVARLMAAMGDMTTSLNAFDEELKARGYARMKEAADQLGPKLDQLTGVLAQYVDDLPAVGHRDSQVAETVVTADDPIASSGARNVGAKTQQAPRTPEDAILAWVAANNGGALPWDVPGRAALPDGVNPAQHQAPRTGQ